MNILLFLQENDTFALQYKLIIFFMIRKTIYYLLFITINLIIGSCAVLTKSQLQRVNNLTVASDTVVVTPKIIFDELATVRLERGLYFAASLTSAAAREKEINALATAFFTDKQLLNRTELYVNVLNSYLRALRSISAATRWSEYGTAWRGIGRNIDSLILRTNQTELLDTKIPIGWAKLSGQYMGYLSERYMRVRQTKAVRSFVTEGDTLVALCVEGLIDLLKKGDLIALIDNESDGLKANYKAYLYRLELGGLPADFAADRKYIELVKRLELAKYTRGRCVTALQALRRAHAKLVEELKKKQNVDFYIDELIELNSLALSPPLSLR